MSATLAFCGAGLMGAPMIRRLLAAGHRVRVWNRSAAKAQALAASSSLRWRSAAARVAKVGSVIAF
ncbi:NAD(P)-binding domain-containing protein, partial [Bordetella bronchiseptica]